MKQHFSGSALSLRLQAELSLRSKPNSTTLKNGCSSIHVSSP